MKQDDSFPQRWELRNSKVDGDTTSSDDDDQQGSNPKGNETDTALVTTDLVLYENHRPPPANQKKKTTTTKKKKVMQKKETNKKRKHDRSSFNDKAMFKDLKIFADTLINELAAARESMFTHMRDEMKSMIVAKKKVAHAELQKVRMPCPIPSSQLQNRINSIGDYGGVGPGIDICRLMGFPGRLAEMGGGFGVKNWGLYGEGRSYTGHIPIPLHHNYLNRGGNIARFASVSGTSFGDKNLHQWHT